MEGQPRELNTNFLLTIDSLSVNLAILIRGTNLFFLYKLSKFKYISLRLPAKLTEKLHCIQTEYHRYIRIITWKTKVLLEDTELV